jgi:hypothetical protein
MTPLFQTIWAVYCLAALVYTLYSATTESGLDAYLLRLEMNIIGGAEEVLTALLAFGVLLAPLWAITRVVEKLAPSLVWASADTHDQFEAGLAKPGLMGHLNRPVQTVSWKVVLVVTAIPILVGAVLFPVMHYSEQRDRQEKVHSIDLTSGLADLPKGAKFVDLTGLVDHSYVLTFKRTFNSSVVSQELFAPVTGNGWTPADPVLYFVRDVSYEDPQGKTHFPDAFRRKGAARFSGEISRSLPAYVESEFRSKGLKLGAAYSVIELKNLPDRQSTASSGEPELAAGFCLFVAVCMFVMMMLVRIMMPRMRKKQYERR